MTDQPLVFECEGMQLLGVLSLPETHSSDIGVVIAVGGPQYRAGSHRQFVLLARRLALAGFAVLRFDVRGMGDSEGDFPGFEAIGPDIRAAVQALQASTPVVKRVVGWGLCDAASAWLMNAAGLAGLVLLNPWVRHTDTLAETEVKHYYAKRLLDGTFWCKLVAGDVKVLAAMREVIPKLARTLRSRLRSQAVSNDDFRERMVAGATGFKGPQLYVLSGRDHVCAEFQQFARSHQGWNRLWHRADVRRMEFPDADHTFSSAAMRREVEDATVAWLDGLASQHCV